MSSKSLKSKDVTEMTIVEIADKDKFLRINRWKDDKRKDSSLNPKKKEETILQGSSKERSQTWQRAKER